MVLILEGSASRLWEYLFVRPVTPQSQCLSEAQGGKQFSLFFIGSVAIPKRGVGCNSLFGSRPGLRNRHGTRSSTSTIWVEPIDFYSSSNALQAVSYTHLRAH